MDTTAEPEEVPETSKDLLDEEGVTFEMPSVLEPFTEKAEESPAPPITLTAPSPKVSSTLPAAESQPEIYNPAFVVEDWKDSILIDLSTAEKVQETVQALGNRIDNMQVELTPAHHPQQDPCICLLGRDHRS